MISKNTDISSLDILYIFGGKFCGCGDCIPTYEGYNQQH
jgi:hypothetical protein